MRIPVLYNLYCVKIEYLLFSTISTSFIFKLKILYLCTKTGVTVVCSLRYIATRKDNLMNSQCTAFLSFQFYLHRARCCPCCKPASKAPLARAVFAYRHWAMSSLSRVSRACRHDFASDSTDCSNYSVRPPREIPPFVRRAGDCLFVFLHLLIWSIYTETAFLSTRSVPVHELFAVYDFLGSVVFTSLP